MQRVRVSPRLEAGGWGVQRHSARQVDRGGRRAEGGDQAARGEVGREQWGVEGSSGKQGKRLLIFPPSDLFLSCRLFFPITLAFQRENTLLKFRDKHWLISCFLYGSENGKSCTVSWNQEKLEADIKVKKNSLLIDQQKCMSMRRTLPYNIVATRYF